MKTKFALYSSSLLFCLSALSGCGEKCDRTDTEKVFYNSKAGCESSSDSSLTEPTPAPSYDQYLYTANRGDGTVSALFINPTSGSLSGVPGSPYTASASGFGTLGIAADPNGKYLYVSNITDGTIYGYAISQSNGSLTAVPGSPYVTASDTRGLAINPTGTVLCATHYRGAGGVSCYTINSSTGALTIVAGSPFASVGWSFEVTFSPNGSYVYVSNWLTGDVNAYSINGAGALTPIGGGAVAMCGGTAKLVVDPTGGFLYGACDGFVGRLTINSSDGTLSGAVTYATAAVRYGFGIVISPDGRFVHTANRNDPGAIGNIWAFTRNTSDGNLTSTASSPYNVGENTYAIAEDATGSFLYTTSGTNNNVNSYSINSTTGELTAISGAPFSCGGDPQGVTIAQVPK